MKTISEFKKRLVPGTVLTTKHYQKNAAGELNLQRTYAGRIVVENAPHAFLIKTEISRSPGIMTNWYSWPIREFFRPIDENAVAIETDTVRIEFLITGAVAA